MKPILQQMRPLLQQATAKIPRSKKHRLRLLAILLAVLALLGAGIVSIHSFTSANAATGDWPMYLHDYSRDAAGADTTISPANASQLTLNWAFKTGGPIASSATVVGGTVYVGSWDGYEYALDTATGALQWKTYLGRSKGTGTGDCQRMGISSTATVRHNIVYVGG